MGISLVASVLTSTVSSQGSNTVTGSYTTSNIKRQTQVQEWMHWKKHALDSSDFEEYKRQKTAELEFIRALSHQYIRSDDRSTCVAHEKRRIPTALILGAEGLALNRPRALIFVD